MSNIDDLKKEIPYKWRVQSFSKNKAQAQCVAYIDARDVEDILDEVVEPYNWQDDYRVIDNKLFAGIGINTGTEWVWKWDTGVESNIEKEKGQSSDAFKRAGVKWGIGRFLYKMGIQYVAANEKKTQGNYPYPVDNAGKRIWDLTRHINGEQKGKAKELSPPKTPPKDTFITKAQAQALIAIAKSQHWPSGAIKDHMKDVAGCEETSKIKQADYQKLMTLMSSPPMICQRSLARMNILLNKVCPGERQDQHNMVGDALQATPPTSLNNLTWEQAEKVNDILFQLELQMDNTPPIEQTEEEPF